MAKNIHIGSIIRETLEKKGMPITEFARRLNKTKGGAYYIFEQPGINTDLLIEIGEVLEYDFFQHFTSGGKAPSGSTGRARKKVSVLIEVEEGDKQEKLLKLLGVTVK